MKFKLPGSFRSAEDFRSRLGELGLSVALDDACEGAEGPLGQPLEWAPGRRLANRFAIHPMEGWDGTRDGSPSDLTLRRWRRCIRLRRGLFTDQLPSGLAQREKLFFADILDKVLGTSVFVLWLLAILGILGVPVTVLATAGGLGAAAVAFGAQSVVSNSLTGFSIYLNRPFVVGDLIEIASQDLQGTVEKIGWFYTQLRTLDRQLVFIPNAIFSTQALMNISQTDNRRLLIDFSVRYDDRERIAPICEELTRRVQSMPGVNPERELWTLFKSYGESSLDCRLVCCSESGDRIAAWHLQHHLLLLIGDVVQAHGASMPFPTRTLIGGGGG